MVISFNQSTLALEKTVTTFKIYRTNSSRKMEKEIMSVLKYFSFFAYNPTSEEIYTFLQAKINKNSLNIKLDRMVRQKLIVNYNKYTPPQYSIRKIKDQKSKIKNSEKKLNNLRFRLYVKLISLFPQIKLIGLSGSISMMNAGEEDDIDLFIIASKNRLFTGRFIALVLAQMFGLRRLRDSATQIFQKTNKTEKFAFASSQKYSTPYVLQPT